MNGYFFKFVKPDIVEIQEEGVTYRLNRNSVEAALANIRANEQAYTSTAFFQRVVKLHEDALKFIDEEMQK